MIEKNPGDSGAAEHQPDATVADENEPAARAQERPAPSHAYRSNEFWLALAGIAATVIVGITGFWFTYKSSADKIQADEQHATIDNRKNRLC